LYRSSRLFCFRAIRSAAETLLTISAGLLADVRAARFTGGLAAVRGALFTGALGAGRCVRRTGRLGAGVGLLRLGGLLGLFGGLEGLPAGLLGLFGEPEDFRLVRLVVLRAPPPDGRFDRLPLLLEILLLFFAIVRLSFATDIRLLSSHSLSQIGFHELIKLSI
jgi:hypothetical protein